MKKEKKKERKEKGSIKSLTPLLIFLGKFALVIAGYYTFVLLTNENIFKYYLMTTAYISSFMLNILGQHTSVNETVITSATVNLQLLFGCEGTDPIIIFFAGMVAVPISIKRKWLPALAGITSLYTLNFIRIAGLFFVKKNISLEFELYHTVIFPLIFILFAMIGLGLCIKWAAKR
jgi:exosortase/archaeosortase family protein